MPVFTVATAAENGRKGAAVANGVKYSTIKQAVELKELAYNAAMRLKEEPENEERASRVRAYAQAVGTVIKAWDIAAERLRILRGKPLPGNLRPDLKQKLKADAEQEIKQVVDNALSLLSTPAPVPMPDSATRPAPAPDGELWEEQAG